MKVRILAGLAGAWAAGALLPVGTLSAQEEALRWGEGMRAGQTLEVKGITGDIRAVLAPGSEAQVVAVKRGDRSDYREVAVEVARSGDRIVICAVYGSWNHGQGRCDPDESWERGDRNRRRNESIDVEVDFEVRVPAGVEFEGTMVSGRVEAEDLRSDVRATTVSGPVFVSTTGRAWANSVSGDLEVRMGETGEEMEFETVSGDITLWLPADFGAEVDFSSLSGDFESDFDVTTRVRRGRWVGQSLKGTIGDGGQRLSIGTVSGDVRLRRAGR